MQRCGISFLFGGRWRAAAHSDRDDRLIVKRLHSRGMLGCRFEEGIDNARRGFIRTLRDDLFHSSSTEQLDFC